MFFKKSEQTFSHWLFSQNTPSWMLDRVLNMPLHYLSCCAVVLRGIHGKLDICQIDYNIHSRLKIFLYSEVRHGNTTFQDNEGFTKFKETWSTIKFDVFVLSLISFLPMSQTISVISRSGVCYFLHTSN